MDSPVTPGSPGRDALDDMLHHHARIRAQFAALRAIEADLRDRGTEALSDARALAEQVVAVFGREGQLHALDESESLFPRLRATLGYGDDELAHALAHLEDDHRTPCEEWPVLRSWLWMLTVPDEPVGLSQIREGRVALEAHFIPHMELEERLVFPAARARLDPAALRAIAAECQDRRTRRATHGQPLMA